MQGYPELSNQSICASQSIDAKDKYSHVKLRPVHTYQDSFVCANILLQIEINFRMHPSGDRFQKFVVSVCVFSGYVWTKGVSATNF